MAHRLQDAGYCVYQASLSSKEKTPAQLTSTTMKKKKKPHTSLPTCPPFSSFFILSTMAKNNLAGVWIGDDGFTGRYGGYARGCKAARCVCDKGADYHRSQSDRSYGSCRGQPCVLVSSVVIAVTTHVNRLPFFLRLLLYSSGYCL